MDDPAIQNQVMTAFAAAAAVFASAVEELGIEFTMISFVPRVQMDGSTKLHIVSNVIADQRGWMCAKYLQMLVSDETKETPLLANVS